ncbi:hypothetical protein MRX96_024983 [Rhipicephalus microplus]
MPSTRHALAWPPGSRQAAESRTGGTRASDRSSSLIQTNDQWAAEGKKERNGPPAGSIGLDLASRRPVKDSGEALGPQHRVRLMAARQLTGAISPRVRIHTRRSKSPSPATSVDGFFLAAEVRGGISVRCS